MLHHHDAEIEPVVGVSVLFFSTMTVEHCVHPAHHVPIQHLTRSF